ncbi:hypothetical protein K439DRAFT_1633675 [Ramaria rubella]|nr:hypothetical protein K439DRAFT_1633675 [Ramaria rubella]
MARACRMGSCYIVNETLPGSSTDVVAAAGSVTSANSAGPLTAYYGGQTAQKITPQISSNRVYQSECFNRGYHDGRFDRRFDGCFKILETVGKSKRLWSCFNFSTVSTLVSNFPVCPA